MIEAKLKESAIAAAARCCPSTGLGPCWESSALMT